MISVIVPVYNVEPYLRKCLDSIVGQTYRDLEILIIDDGSTDGSGAICDEYKRDGRVKVFHTENRGLSAARNLGLDEATGEWIGFVDSDDWIEPDMYEVLIDRAEETGADVVECRAYLEFPDRTEEREKSDMIVSGKKAVQALIHHELSSAVWNKLYKRQCFNQIRFPEGRIFEEIATTYRLFGSVRMLCCVSISLYHYFQRDEGLSRQRCAKNTIDFWQSHKERYDNLIGEVDKKGQHELLRLCALAASYTWVKYYEFQRSEWCEYYEYILDMNEFTRKHIPLFGINGWGIKMRIGIFFPHFLNGFSFRTAWGLNRIKNLLKRKRLK